MSLTCWTALSAELRPAHFLSLRRIRTRTFLLVIAAVLSRVTPCFTPTTSGLEQPGAERARRPCLL
uniref:Uncharacterized protein n=1 Tax=Anguilla anguilla TaxID=7936 RepID=A0A0E9SI69_ANGAN